jgi:hypothetical protein
MMNNSQPRVTRNSVDGLDNDEKLCGHENCGRVINELAGDTFIQCCTCRLYYHTAPACGNVNTAFYNGWKKSDQAFWSCLGCLPTTQAMFRGLRENSTAVKKLSSEVSELRNLVETSLAGRPPVRGGDPGNAQRQQDHGHAMVDRDSVLDEAVVELKDQQRRECNLIIFNLVESRDDRALFNNVLLATKADPASVCVKELVRLKNPKATGGGTKPPPLKICFANASDPGKVLSGCKNLGLPDVDERFKKCSVKRDLTPRQRAQQLVIYNEYKRRKESGENVVIFRGKVVPKNELPPKRPVGSTEA